MFTKNWKILLTKLEDNRGSVLLTTYMLTMVLLILGAAFLVLSSNESRISEVQRKTTQAFYIAEAGIERAIYDLKEDFANSQDWTDGNINGLVFAYHGDEEDLDDDDILDAGEDTDSDGLLDPHFVLLPYVSTGLNDGSYSVSLMNVTGTDDIWIRSTGTIGSISQTILVYATIVSLSPWDNAIFGGAGQSGRWVNGNVNVSGSVHVLGSEDKNGNGVLDSGEDANDNGVLDELGPGDTAIDLGGTAELVRNNYEILDAALEARIPVLPRTTVNGEDVETLNAELRVKHGNVGLSGSSTLGEPDNPGDDEKETVDAVYITDGYSGNQGASNVYSDNGTDQAYDLGDAVVFPSLDDPYPDNPIQDYYEYFEDNALVLTTELSAVTASSIFTYGDCATNCITMDGAGTMVIQGIIYVDEDNDLSISGPQVGGDITYTGTGSILVTGSVEIDANVVTPAPAGVETTFPDNILGIMTPNNIALGNAADRDIMGLFYAEGEVITNMQTNLVGTIVANEFNIASQVPSVFQVPEAANNLPPGMVGGDAANILRIVSWQKIDNP